jgi:hypothetical protein
MVIPSWRPVNRDISHQSNGQNIQPLIGDISLMTPPVADMNVEGRMTLTDWTGTTRLQASIYLPTASQVGTTNV